MSDPHCATNGDWDMEYDEREDGGFDTDHPDERGSCHADCTIGPSADHHGTMSYRCMDADGKALPFPGEHPHGLRCMTDPCADCADEMISWTLSRPLDTLTLIPEVHPNTAALNILAGK